MKIRISILVMGVLLVIISCEKISNSGLNSNQTNDSNDKKDTLIINKLDYIVFGQFCSECGGECATMYKLDNVSNKLLVDHTDSYWEYKWEMPMRFETHIDNETKILLAKQVLDSIPESILAASKRAERFGCPDCTDNCGIFLETKCYTIIKKFYFDYQTEQLTGDIKLFVEHIKKIIEKL